MTLCDLLPGLVINLPDSDRSKEPDSTIFELCEDTTVFMKELWPFRTCGQGEGDRCLSYKP